MAIYAIGDIHGCYRRLVRLMSSIEKSEDDTFVFLGDYIDKGKDSKKVIDYLIRFSLKYKSVFLRGNHEQLMLDARKDKNDFEFWYSRGGDKTLKSYRISKKKKWKDSIPKEHWKFIKQTILYYQTEGFVFVHAGLKPKVPLEQQDVMDMIRKRYESPERYSKKSVVICGHTVRKDGDVANYGHTICIDTNACGGKYLSCLNTENLHFTQVGKRFKLRKGILISDINELKILRKSG